MRNFENIRLPEEKWANNGISDICIHHAIKKNKKLGGVQQSYTLYLVILKTYKPTVVSSSISSATN